MNDFRKPSPQELKKSLTPLQFKVTQEEGTEPPFKNEFWDNHKDGIYVDIVSGEPLFSSQDKYDSGTGWPSFSKPLEAANIVTKKDRTLWMVRTEVRSKGADSHLGHVFDDGPAPTGMRYCMNSAAMRFVPVDRLQAEGLDRYLPLFAKADHGHASTAPNATPERETAVLAGGCFWGMEEIIRSIPGVLNTSVGYTGGASDYPIYEQVKTGKTGHAEAIEIVFDPRIISYEELLGFFFRMHDPTTTNRQGNDVGSQYRSAIFVGSDGQRLTAEKVKRDVDQSAKWRQPVVTEIVAAKKFWPAEDYHQDYLQKHPGGYSCHFLRD